MAYITAHTNNEPVKACVVKGETATIKSAYYSLRIKMKKDEISIVTEDLNAFKKIAEDMVRDINKILEAEANE